jgi:hypothetical protein
MVQDRSSYLFSFLQKWFTSRMYTAHRPVILPTPHDLQIARESNMKTSVDAIVTIRSSDSYAFNVGTYKFLFYRHIQTLNHYLQLSVLHACQSVSEKCSRSLTQLIRTLSRSRGFVIQSNLSV